MIRFARSSQTFFIHPRWSTPDRADIRFMHRQLQPVLSLHSENRDCAEFFRPGYGVASSENDVLLGAPCTDQPTMLKLRAHRVGRLRGWILGRCTASRREQIDSPVHLATGCVPVRSHAAPPTHRSRRRNGSLKKMPHIRLSACRRVNMSQSCPHHRPHRHQPPRR